MYFIIDGFNLAYRSGIINEDLTNSKGEPSGMVFGFVRSIKSLKERFRNMKFIVAWDNRPQWKYDIYPQYKEGRTASIGGLNEQLRALKAILYLLDIDQYQKSGEEADDVIATLVNRFREQGLVQIYTNDKDMLGLVEDGKCIVMRPKVGFNPEKFFDEEAVKEKFGVEPKNLIDFRSFDGDSSDALPGVPRVPRKKIIGLLNKYGSVEGVYSNISKENLTEFQKNAILDSEVQVRMNRRIMNLNRNLPELELSPGVTAHRQPTESESEKLTRIFKYYDVRSIDPEMLIALFLGTSYIKFSDSVPTMELEIDDDLFSD